MLYFTPMYPMTTYPHETHPDWSGCDTILKCPIGYFLARKKLSRLFPQSPLNSHPQRRIRRSHKKQYSNNGNVIHHEPNMAKSNFSSHGKYNSHGNWCQMMAITIQDKNCMCKMMRSRRRSRPRWSRKRCYGRTDDKRQEEHEENHFEERKNNSNTWHYNQLGGTYNNHQQSSWNSWLLRFIIRVL